MNTTELLDNEEFVQDLKGFDLTGTGIARKWGCGETFAKKWRNVLREADGLPTGAKVVKQKAADAAETFDENERGDIIKTKRSDRIIPLSEWLADLESDGHDAEDFTYSHGHSIWEQGSREDGTKTLYANRFSATKKAKKSSNDADYDAVLDSVRDQIECFVPDRGRVLGTSGHRSLVVCAADFQLGKVDINGNTEDTARQILNSFAAAADIARREHPLEIVIVDAGDILENLWNTSSQRATNDLGLPHQVEAAVRLMLAGIRMFAPLAPSIKYVAVPSNHGRSRVGFKAEAGDAHDDYGIAIAKIIRNALTLNDSFSHIEVVLPEAHLESLAFNTSGSLIGVAHGHQSGSSDRIAEWWRGQALGNGPTADARLLLIGHWHHLEVRTAGDDRHIFVCPSSDRGSSWFTNLKGESSRSGMLTFFTADNEWSDLRVV